MNATQTARATRRREVRRGGGGTGAWFLARLYVQIRCLWNNHYSRQIVCVIEQERDFRRGIRYHRSQRGQMRTPRNLPILSAYLPAYLRFPACIRVGSACAQITKWILAARAAFPMICAIARMDQVWRYLHNSRATILKLGFRKRGCAQVLKLRESISRSSTCSFGRSSFLRIRTSLLIRIKNKVLAFHERRNSARRVTG